MCGVIAERPGVTVSEIAEVTRIAKPLVYNTTRAGVERGELEVALPAGQGFGQHRRHQSRRHRREGNAFDAVGAGDWRRRLRSDAPSLPVAGKEFGALAMGRDEPRLYAASPNLTICRR